MSHRPKPSNDIADILAGTLMVSRGTALDIMRDTLATTGTQCQWRQADTISMPDTWEADCGAAWTFTDGGPKDNSMKFCPQCGHSLKQIDNAMTHKNDPYASEAETQALLAPDTRTEAERRLDKMMDELGAWEQGAEPYPLLRHIALELLKKQLAEQPAQADGETIVQTFTGLPRRKLRELLAGGWEVNGVCFQRTEEDGTVRRGAATIGGMVIWWNAEQPAQKRPPNCGTGFCSCIECVMEPKQPAPTKCWKCGDADPAFTDVCQVPACGMREQP